MFMKICEDIHNLCELHGVDHARDKLSLVSLLTPINYCHFVDAGDQALSRIFIDFMTPAINISPVITTPAIIYPR
jgi:hypothetical protein